MSAPGRVREAAPALYEALRRLRNYLDSDPDLYEGDDDHVLGKLMCLAQEALDRAEGGD